MGSISSGSFKDKISSLRYRALSSKLIFASRQIKSSFLVKTNGFISIKLASFSTKILYIDFITLNALFFNLLDKLKGFIILLISWSFIEFDKAS